MRKWIALLLFAAATATISAAPPDGVHAAIRHYREALKSKDLAALEAVWTDDYVFVNGHGQLRTKADRLADIRSGASSIDSITHEEAPTVRTHGKNDAGPLARNDRRHVQRPQGLARLPQPPRLD